MRKFQRHSFWTLFVLLVFIACQSTENKEKYIQGYGLGTTYHIKIQGKGANITSSDINRLIEQLNATLSTYKGNSLISRINQGKKLKSNVHFTSVFKEAQKIYKKTGGIYDPTVGILVNAWGFGPGKKIPGIEHDSSLVDSLMQYVGFYKIHIDKKGYVQKENPYIFIDFNSIAKGYVIDQIGIYIKKKGYKNFIVELGGEVLASGKNIIENRPWEVGIESPLKDKNLELKLTLENEAVATSGNYRKYRIDPETGKKYVHTINPLTGYPEVSNLLSASIIAPTCTEADGWATACMAGGLEKAKKWIEETPEIKGILIYSDSLHHIKIWHSPGLKLKIPNHE